MQYILGIDIGTGSTKAVAVDSSGKILHTEQASYPTLTPAPTFAEQAPEVIWQAFLKCIRRTTTHLAQSPAGVSLSSAMHSVIPMGEQDSPLRNMIIWADNRSASIAEKIRNAASGEMLYEQTGTPIHAMAPLSKIVWLREQESELFSRTKKFISIKEYIWFKLFGVYEVDYSIASATGLFDIEKLTWNENSLSLCEMTADRLSVLVNPSHQRSGVNPEVAQQTGVSKDTPFFIGSSDGCMANLGTFATEPGVAALTIGTSGAIRVANTKPTFDFSAMTFNYRLDEATYISGGPINNGGVALKWYVQNFLKKELNTAEDYDMILSTMEDINPGANGLIFLPYILGERAPLWNSEACGVFFGITAQHTQAHFTRAVIEGICLSLYNIGRHLEDSGLSIQQINVSGGFVRAEQWLQMLADIFGKPIGLVSSEDASAIGAAYLAMKNLGMIKNYDAFKPDTIRLFQPDMKHHEIYRERIFPLFRNLTDRLMLDMAVVADMRGTSKSS